jgi:chemotaxis methyl-accepting protein methylase
MVFIPNGRRMAHLTEVIDLSELAWLVKSRCGIDLSRYRATTLNRRVMHRMAMTGSSDIEEYLGRLTADHDEMDRLLDIITIHVTEFFRDRDVFRSLENGYVPALIDEKTGAGHGSVRAWSAGCSTGEEAYSMAMMIDRAVRKVSPNTHIEVFGTDVSEDSCRTARKGVYCDEKLESLPADIRESYFEKEGRCWKVTSGLRSMVKFMSHDLFTDPPYSHLDLIMCRNVMIHFEHEVRDEVIGNFHESLQDRGLLVLGKSEALAGPLEELFELVEPRCKIYRKKVTEIHSREE